MSALSDDPGKSSVALDRGPDPHKGLDLSGLAYDAHYAGGRTASTTTGSAPYPYFNLKNEFGDKPRLHSQFGF